jgi:hypothetical protein
METKWFSEDQTNVGIRYYLYKRNTKLGAWGKTSYFIDAASNRAHYTYGEKYGLYGSGMGDLIDVSPFPYRIAACFGGFKKLSDAKKCAEKHLLDSLE